MISIHAPVKGATYFLKDIFDYIQISIHAPVKGATIGLFNTGVPDIDFNSRSREGSDVISLHEIF